MGRAKGGTGALPACMRGRARSAARSWQPCGCRCQPKAVRVEGRSAGCVLRSQACT